MLTPAAGLPLRKFLPVEAFLSFPREVVSALLLAQYYGPKAQKMWVREQDAG